MNKWPILLLIMQILLLFAAFYGLWHIGEVMLDIGRPTPTCPQGIYSTLMPTDVTRQCWVERLELYIPRWSVPLSRIAVVASMLCMLGSVAFWAVRRSREPRLRTHMAFQFGIYCVALILHLLVFPWGLGELAKFVLYGLQ